MSSEPVPVVPRRRTPAARVVRRALRCGAQVRPDRCGPRQAQAVRAAPLRRRLFEARAARARVRACVRAWACVCLRVHVRGRARVCACVRACARRARVSVRVQLRLRACVCARALSVRGRAVGAQRCKWALPLSFPPPQRFILHASFDSVRRHGPTDRLRQRCAARRRRRRRRRRREAAARAYAHAHMCTYVAMHARARTRTLA
jgi:hypothetical protein